MRAIKRWRSAVPFLIRLTSAGLVCIGLYIISLDNFLLFHTLAELFSVLIALSIFVLAWNARYYLDNQAIVFLSIAYFFVGLLDLIHTIAYKGMYIFPTAAANVPTQLWLAARYLQAVALVLAPLLSWRFFRSRLTLGLFGAVTALLLASIFYWRIFPAAYIENTGLTPFKITSEYVIGIILMAALLIWLWKRPLFDAGVLRLFIFSIGLTIVSELMFTVYKGVTDTPNAIGHILKIIAFYLVYKAVIETGLARPYQLLFRNLQQSRDDLLKERDFISAILNTANALVVVLEANGRVVRVNRAFEQTTGYLSEEISGLFLWELKIFPGNHTQLQSAFQGQDEEIKLFDGESRLITKDQRTCEIAWSSGSFMDGDQGLRYIISTGIDITDRKQAETELIYLSTHDILTGLYNRAFFESEMLRLAGTDHFPTSVVMMDLDGLKSVNDTFGHQMGDRLIQEAAQLIKSSFREEDVIARMGGDEFAVILPGADEMISDQARRRVRANLKHHNHHHPELPISLSFGSATAIAGYMLVETLKQADHAMYRDKMAHRARQPRLY